MKLSFLNVFILMFSVAVLALPPGQITERIAIDQFGYLPEMTKIAVISDPQQGFNAADSYTPGGLFEVRRWDTNEIVATNAVTAWKSGAIHDQSGDKLWWFDFSALTCPGTYYIYDPANDARSSVFKIGLDVYKDVLKQAVRMFYYQRCGVAKQTPFADQKWTDTVCHSRDTQDKKCRLVSAPNDAATEKDLTGGWHDAGDYNKYTNFTTGTLSDLLFAYQNNPGVWSDDYGLPETGNGLPDILDETKWELDWLLKMQNTDGSVLSKVSVTQFQATSPPSADASARYYGAASTSATLSGAISFAHAAVVFNALSPAYAATLRAAALKAWAWAEANPNIIFTNAGFQSANSEISDYDRQMYKLMAAVYLYAATQEDRFRTYVEGNYTQTHLSQWGYWYGFESTVQDAMLYFTTLPNISANVATAIRNSKQGSMGGSEFLPAYTGATDGYRAYLKTGDYVWGSNTVKGHIGTIFLNQAVYKIDIQKTATYKEAGAGYVHYFHGVNPVGLVQLTNMYSVGAARSANEMYHSWFGDGTVYDNALTSPKGPPPGYVMGGANPTYQPDAAYTGPAISPPMNQPAQKSYKDWNTSWPQNSWTITEPAIYSQASYVNLLATVINQYGPTSSRVAAGVCSRPGSGRHPTSR